MNYPPVRYLVLWLTTACNLSCLYCYRKEDDHAVMSKEVARTALFLAAQSGLPFHVQLAGGEPTLEPAMIEFVGCTVREARWPATLAVQTNGILWKRDMIELCRQHNIAIGVSLDGPPDVQDALRGMSGATFRSLSLFEKERMPVRVTTVLSSANAHRLRDLVFALSGFGNIRGIGFDPLVMSGGAQKKPELLPSSEAVHAGIQDFMQVLEQMKSSHNIPFEWREMQVVRRAISEKGTSRPYCHACRGESIAVHPNGQVYPCGQTIGDREMAAGTVDAVDWTKLHTCYEGFKLNGNCSSCPLENHCPGECPSRLRYNNGIVPPAMCTIYRAIAENITGKYARRSNP